MILTDFPGVGELQKVASQVQESLSIYVNGLPLDFSEEEIGCNILRMRLNT
jgi:hypothetical protein